MYAFETLSSHLANCSSLASSLPSYKMKALTSFLPALGAKPSFSQKRMALGSTWTIVSDLPRASRGKSNSSSETDEFATFSEGNHQLEVRAGTI